MHYLASFFLDSDGEGEGSGKLTSPTAQASPKTPSSGKKGENVWRSVFNPGRNYATKNIGAEMFDKPLPNTPTVYDWYHIITLSLLFLCSKDPRMNCILYLSLVH